MSKKQKNKKVNHLSLVDCGQILNRLAVHKESKYYQDVLNRFKQLVPAHEFAYELAKLSSETQATFKSSQVNLEENNL